MNDSFLYLCVDLDDSILSVFKKMDVTKHRLLIVTKNKKFYSLISIGDIQRAIINNIDINTSISGILRVDVTVAHVLDDKEQIKQSMLQRRNEFMPILSDDNEIVDVILWETLFSEQRKENSVNLKLPVVIMAGGKGTRMAPLTNVLPKPLIPINNKTMLEDIMDRFLTCGCSDFFISVNYKADMIRYYIDSLKNPDYHIQYFQEDKPLGTAGSLHLLNNKIKSTFFVTNCDILIEQDYAEILEYHRANKNEITVVAAVKSIQIPYGTIQTKEDGLIESLVEKPEYSFKINTGFYILEPHLIAEIPTDTFFHITYLIEKLYKEGRRVGVFPVHDGAWTDIGNWKEYLLHISQNNE